jgi:hypothetical protein
MEKQRFMDTLRQTTRTPLEKMENGSYNAHWRGASRGFTGERATLHAGTASEGVSTRCSTPIQSSHEIGWHTKPLVRRPLVCCFWCCRRRRRRRRHCSVVRRCWQ